MKRRTWSFENKMKGFNLKFETTTNNLADPKCRVSLGLATKNHSWMG